MAMRQFLRIAHWLMALGPVALCFLTLTLSAQTNAPDDASLAAQDKDGCIRNLKVIYDAIQLYQMDHKELPNWLSDLVPQYLDANTLICPACKRTGEIESSALADPKLPCSYLYEFCPMPLGKNDAPGDPTKTRRDWKRRQMGLVGSVVPIVRCRHHGSVLNLAFDGKVYESGPSWEDLLANRFDITQLESARIFPAAPGAGVVADTAALPGLYPPRDPNASPRLINLDKYYNAPFTESWNGKSSNNLASLPTGVEKLAGVEYDVRGLVQLGCRSRPLRRFPSRVEGIQIHQKCTRLCFLHSIVFGGTNDDGVLVGSYIVHFATNAMQLQIPIIYGRDARNWHRLRDEPPGPALKIAWTGTNETSHGLRLFTTIWTNVAPDVKIDSVDFVSAMGGAAPFLIAITAE
jgi:hypothetical protein